ncbi:hypothetical protein EMIHUDRAFT_434136, partial [Emiliania huxleyi CCMP1516]|uniref:Uncharacterized protein n=2 Tax=Emiliania huxleyi TaxID=2903 RepID=A0A0D3KBZ0_EMIH1
QPRHASALHGRGGPQRAVEPPPFARDGHGLPLRRRHLAPLAVCRRGGGALPAVHHAAGDRGCGLGRRFGGGRGGVRQGAHRGGQLALRQRPAQLGRAAPRILPARRAGVGPAEGAPDARPPAERVGGGVCGGQAEQAEGGLLRDPRPAHVRVRERARAARAGATLGCWGSGSTHRTACLAETLCFTPLS